MGLGRRPPFFEDIIREGVDLLLELDETQVDHWGRFSRAALEGVHKYLSDDRTPPIDSNRISFYDTKVTMHVSSGSDLACVVEIDTQYEPDEVPGIRVYLNDSLLYEGVPYGEPSPPPTFGS